MTHLYRYRVLFFLRDRIDLFWAILFPILLGFFFFMAFGNITAQTENFEAIPVAVVAGEEETPLTELVAQLGEGENATLALVQTSREEALGLLADEEVIGVLETDPAKLTFKEDGIRQSVLKGILDRYLQVEATLTAIAKNDPSALPAALETLTNTDALIQAGPKLGGSGDYITQYFYALVGMACLYGGFFGLTAVRAVQANLSSLGSRRSVSPTSKGKLVASDFLASLTISFAGVCLLLAFLRFVLGIEMGLVPWAILLLCLVGCAGGVVLGMAVGTLVRLPPGAADGVYIAISLTLSFFGGLMNHDIRHMVEQTAPIFNRLNPASLIADSFYALDAYGTGSRYWTNLAWLAAITLVLGIACVVSMRRRRYASV